MRVIPKLILSSTGGGSFDPSANQTITGEYEFDISGGKSFLVSNDLSYSDPFNATFIGIIDHDLSPTSILGGYQVHNSTGASEIGSYGFVYDDGSASHKISLVSNGSGSCSDVVNITSGGVSTRTIAADTINLTGVRTYSGYKSGTLASPPTGMVIGEEWLDTTDSATHPILRVSTVTT